MSRSGYKTINLPRDLVEQVDSALEARCFRTPLSRDEFVRHAISILLIGITDINVGLQPLERMQHAIQGITKPPPAIEVPDSLQRTPRLVELLQQEGRGGQWAANIVAEIIRQKANQSPEVSSLRADLAAFGIDDEQFRKTIEVLRRTGRIAVTEVGRIVFIG